MWLRQRPLREGECVCKSFYTMKTDKTWQQIGYNRGMGEAKVDWRWETLLFQNHNTPLYKDAHLHILSCFYFIDEKLYQVEVACFVQTHRFWHYHVHCIKCILIVLEDFLHSGVHIACIKTLDYSLPCFHPRSQAQGFQCGKA